jgi:hypothetical protein
MPKDNSPFALMWSGAGALALVLTPVLMLLGQPTRIDFNSQVRNSPAPNTTYQTTHLPSFLDEARRVAAPSANVACAVGTWSLDAQYLYLCVDQAGMDYRWRRIQAGPLP